jgi:hypothetical protein
MSFSTLSLRLPWLFLAFLQLFTCSKMSLSVTVRDRTEKLAAQEAQALQREGNQHLQVKELQ